MFIDENCPVCNRFDTDTILRLNHSDFFECPACHSQISIAVHPEIDPEENMPDAHKKLMEYQKIHEFTIAEDRVHQLLPANYSKGAPLYTELLGYVKEICENIKDKNLNWNSPLGVPARKTSINNQFFT